MKTLLLYYADDDIDDLNLVKEAAEKYNHQVETFFSGEELLATLKSAEIKPDIVMLDYFMPAADGLQTLKRIKDNYPNLPVVMITGSCSLLMKKNFIDAGANYVVEKPMSFRDQKEIIKIITDIDWNGFKYAI